MNTHIRNLVRAAVDEKYGEGTSALIEDYDAGSHTQEELAMREGVTRQAISNRMRKARTYARRLLKKAGIEGLDMVNSLEKQEA